MVSLGIVAVAGIGYWYGYYDLAFWVLCYAIVNGGLAGIWALANPDWVTRKRVEAGVDGPFDYLTQKPNHGRWSFVATKLILAAAIAPIAWHVGTRAGYF